MEEEAVEDNDNASLPSTTSSFHLSTLFEDSDSDEDDPDAPLHIEHYSPTPPLNLHSTSSPSSSSSPNSASPSTHPSLLPPFTHDQFISFLADGSQASARPPSRTRTSVYPVVTPDDDSSSSEDDSDSDDEEVDGHVVRILAEERAEGRDPWRPLATRRGGGERSSGEGGLGAGFDTRNSLGLEMWLRGAEAEAEAEGGMVGGSENGESWREVRDGGITEEEGDEHLGEFVSLSAFLLVLSGLTRRRLLLFISLTLPSAFFPRLCRPHTLPPHARPTLLSPLLPLTTTTTPTALASDTKKSSSISV